MKNNRNIGLHVKNQPPKESHEIHDKVKSNAKVFLSFAIDSWNTTLNLAVADTKVFSYE